MAVCQNLVPLVNIKIAGKWMFIPLKMVLIGIDPYPYMFSINHPIMGVPSDLTDANDSPADGYSRWVNSRAGSLGIPHEWQLSPGFPRCLHLYIHTHIYIYGKCLGFARTRNDDGRRIIIIIINIMFINIIVIIITIIINIIKPLLTIFNECRSLAGVGELNPFWRSSMNVEV